ncbi:MAG: ABC transporter ATP-binding protein [Spirochaetia bacterium]|jgi:simple sugar transport system ATP-binding protein|nr:ABC transporter ATP-binding protein [Spirochaetia bacterium]
MDSQTALAVKHITMVYPGGVVANRDINLEVRKGEIHALIGENGAGKSTLMNILYGLLVPTKGTIEVDGHAVTFSSSRDAIKAGLGMVHQHFKLVPSLTVAENLILGDEPMKGKYFIDRRKAVDVTKSLSKKYQLNVVAEERVRDISLAMMQKLEILKALYRGARILILDEPTAVLTPQETLELFEQLKLLKSHGITILFISHKLNEVKQLCDRLTVLRDGHAMGTYDVSSLSEKQISTLLVGREVNLDIEKPPVKAGKVVFSAQGLCYTDHFGKLRVNEVSFSVHAGEIVGIAGIDGNGQSELAELIVGSLKQDKGIMMFNGTDISHASIRRRQDLKLSHVSEDRMLIGTAPRLSLEDNLISKSYDSGTLQSHHLYHRKKITEFSKHVLDEFQVKYDHTQQHVTELSGGNIQKLVVGREYTSDPDFIILNQPTRGIDVGSIEFIRKKIIGSRSEGKAILLISADLSEIRSMSDVILVMHEGRIVAYIENVSESTEEELGLYMLGVKEDNPAHIRKAYNG